jgi:hypothetical protein
MGMCPQKYVASDAPPPLLAIERTGLEIPPCGGCGCGKMSLCNVTSSRCNHHAAMTRPLAWAAGGTVAHAAWRPCSTQTGAHSTGHE